MEVAVIGGGDSAAEEALLPDPICQQGVPGSPPAIPLRASKIMADRATSHPKIECVWDSVPKRPCWGVAEGSGERIAGASHVKTGGGAAFLPVKGVFVAIGHVPNTKPFAAGAGRGRSWGYFVPRRRIAGENEDPRVYSPRAIAPTPSIARLITAAGMGCPGGH